MKTYQTLLALLAVGVQYALGNNALALNPSSANATITTRGSDFLWAVFAIMLFCALLMMAWTFSIAPGRRAFHWIGVAILCVVTSASIFFRPETTPRSFRLSVWPFSTLHLASLQVWRTTLWPAISGKLLSQSSLLDTRVTSLWVGTLVFIRLTC